MSFSQAYSKSVIALLVIFFIGYYILRALHSSIGIAYPLATIALLLIVLPLIWWRSIKNFPEGTGKTSQETVKVPSSLQETTKAIPRIVANCGWRLTQEKLDDGQFMGKIGRDIKTIYGQIFQIDLRGSNDRSTEVIIKCEALHQVVDYGRNSKMIAKFKTELNKVTSKSG